MKKFFLLLILIIFFLVSCSANRNQGRIYPALTEITYWQYWTGFEGRAIEKLVNKFNNTHKNIKVKMLTISEPRKKTLLSIIGGTPPDVISSIAAWIPELASRNALIPLDDFCKENRINEKIFISAYWKMLNLYGHTWALPTTPTATALYWNKNLFKKAGLNPEMPPKTLKELEEYSSKLTIKNKKGQIKQIGFLPSWPSWAFGFYGILFGGSWVNNGSRDVACNISANNPKNIEGWNWACGFIKRLGSKNIQLFQEEFGNIQGPNNPFYTEKIALEINGTWEGNFIPRFAPNIKWGAAPMPTSRDIACNVSTIVDCDCILIPKGSKHPREAFEFIKWLLKPENIEELCIAQGKFSPLIVSGNENFIKRHPHPYIKVFIDLAKSKGAVYFPQATFYEFYRRELKRAFESVMRLEKEPKDALDEVQKRMERELERERKYERLRTRMNGNPISTNTSFATKQN
ncbi:MAG: ABC transporter substrate-binding protein [Candidatus Melainabacteria bacterium]|nr:ABC transporter substrate-binding protein [Candidatus Melainabacteria bacterium]